MVENYYLRKMYEDMQLRSYSEHTQLVYGRVVREFLSYTGRDVKVLDEHIDKILSAEKVQTVKICYNFVGDITE